MTFQLLKHIFRIVWFLAIVDLSKVVATNHTAKTQSDLYDKLFGESSNYRSEVRALPLNGRNKLDVTFDISIRTILGLDVKTQIFYLTAVIHMRWQDKRLTWNESEFDGIDTLNVGNSVVWTPDIMLLNEISDEPFSHTDVYRSKVFFNNDGTVIWTNPVTFKSTCQVDVTWFPVDYQVCNLTFGSWSYGRNKMDIKFKNKEKDKEMVYSDFHIPSGEWSLEGVAFFEEEKTFDCCKQTFSVVTFQVFLKRYPNFYYIYVFLPFISQMILFLLIFHIHPDQGDRLGYGVALLLNMTMYMIFLSDHLPEKSDSTPFVGAVFVTFFFLLSIALALSALTMHYSLRETPLPSHVHNLKVLVNKLWPCKNNDPGKSNVRPESKSYGSYDMEEVKQTSTDVDPNLDNQDQEEPIATRSEESSLVEKPGDRNRFKGWFEFMRLVEKILTCVFAFLLIVLPLIIGSLVTERITEV
ncbi:neuronal acetylcholine receptor subunit alpha-7-like [Clytia hemisphaerica]|uniref:Uncharacterized protein n=1 Tax=Clytia hemisphaerica TaxID=252671 RepID=A0A7M5V7M8_9CNID